MQFAILTDDLRLRELLVELYSASAELSFFDDELTLVRGMRSQHHDLILIDFRAAEASASALLTWRDCNADWCTPVIVLTNESSSTELLQWIKVGATDVVSRVDLDEIDFRVRLALQRRWTDSVPKVIRLGRYRLEREGATAFIDDVEIPLTRREFTMAWLFFSNHGKFLSRAQIAASVWATSEQVAARTLDQHIYKLRKKLRLSGSGIQLQTVYAQGYKLDFIPPAEPDSPIHSRAEERHSI